MNVFRVTRRDIRTDETTSEHEYHVMADGPLDALVKVWQARHPDESLQEYTRLTETSWTATNVSGPLDDMFSDPPIRERLWFARVLDVIQ